MNDTKLLYILNDTDNKFQIMKLCAGTVPGLQTAGTDSGRHFIKVIYFFLTDYGV